jgi:non-ribosomal peptide synthase protein (TIGR01720 family)
LLQQAPAVYHTRINDLLLTALGRALGRWGGVEQVLLEMEGHGREPLSETEELDLTRTVGWFTSLYPLRLRTDVREAVGAAIKRTKEESRGVPRQGLSYGAVRYLSDKLELRERLVAVGGAEVIFNYLGQLDQALPQQGWLHGAGESSGASRDESQQRSHLLDIVSSVQGGRLQVLISYSAAVHEREQIERLAENYRESLLEVVDHCVSEGAGGYTPSDFPQSALTQEQLDAVVGARPEAVEDIYVLSPMQEGLLFHALYAPQSAVYFEQMSCRLEGQLETGSFRRAWEAVTKRHSVLRSRFVWEGLRQPVQVVERAVELPWREEDWRELTAREQEEQLEAELERDRAAGFELGQAPLMRVTLLRLGAESYELIWSHHHLVLDGWSLPVLLKEVTAYYEGYCRGEEVELGRSRSYGEYIRWMRQQDLGAAERYWREQLRGFAATTMLGIEASGATGNAEEYEQQWLNIATETNSLLQQLSRAGQVTLNTIVQGAWGVLLSRYSGDSDVVFGATVSGRPAELAGVETMVGVFINTLPVRVRLQ